MSTHANIKIISKSGEKIYYQHYDGYPNGLGKVLEKYINEQSRYHNWDPDIICDALIDGTFGTSWEFKQISKITEDVSYVYNIDCINKTFEIEKWKWVHNEENILLSKSQFEKVVSQKTF